jgi:hypothetical protein
MRTQRCERILGEPFDCEGPLRKPCTQFRWNPIIQKASSGVGGGGGSGDSATAGDNATAAATLTTGARSVFNCARKSSITSVASRRREESEAMAASRSRKRDQSSDTAGDGESGDAGA